MVISRRSTPQDPDTDDAADAKGAVFKTNGRPVYFYLYGINEPESSWALSEDQRHHLTHLIMEHGGHICNSPKDADTIIVKQAGYEELKKKYEFDRTKYVELPMFVHTCISEGSYRHDPIMKRPLGGRPPKRFRNDFTHEDDMKLCQWLANHLPYKDAGGRLGIKPYEDLVDKARYNDLGYQWAARHPADSWRGRYKHNQETFDPIIDNLVRENPPPLDGKGVRPFDRRVNRNAIYARIAEEVDDENGEEGEYEGLQIHPEAQAPARIPHARPRVRRTDIGPQHSASPVEQRRGRVHSAPLQQRAVEHPRADSFEDTGEFQVFPFAFEEGVVEYDVRPSHNDAGPSGTQRTPSASPRAQNRPMPRSEARAVIHEFTAATRTGRYRRQAGGASQIPMSSQATLVGPVPTQLRGASQAAKLPASRPPPRQAEESEEALAAKRPSKKRKIRPPPQPAEVALEPLREKGLGSRSAAQRAATIAGPSIARAQKTTGPEPIASEEAEQLPAAEEEVSESAFEDEDEVLAEDADQDITEDAGDATQSHAVPQTMKDEQDVEHILVAEDGDDNSAFFRPGASEELDSDDQLTRQKLLSHRSRLDPSARSSTGAVYELSQPRVSHVLDAEDEEEFALELDLSRPAERGGSRRAQGPVTPVPERKQKRRRLQREPTDGSSASSEVSGVPIPGTRASKEKQRQKERKRREAEGYVPPAGTQAHARELMLRSRTVAKGAGGRI
ncbi:hypothetical protein BD413DRAFT_31530 [Trametes elegans]|nr:hypothetical protein BD413DRAFT_31530 [Trametes elegans]